MTASVRVALSAALLLVATLTAQARAQAPLAGLWTAEHDFGPAIAGPITLTHANGAWRITIAGRSAEARAQGHTLAIALPAKQGMLRARLNSADAPTEVFWIQPETPGLGAAFATPLALTKRDDGWHGMVRPLHDRLHFYLDIARRDDGTLGAFLRNPELNLGRGRALTVTRKNARIDIGTPGADAPLLHGRYDRHTHKLVLDYADAEIRLAFRRSDPRHAKGFWPRPPGTRYVYRKPAATRDGWKTGTLTANGVDPTAIAALIKRIAATKPAPGKTPYIDSLLIARHGKLVLEEYFHGQNRQKLHTLRSASKTVTSLLFGAAQDHGVPIGPATKVTALFPEYAPLAHPDPRKAQITMADLLSMQSGLACNDNDESSPGNEDVMQSQSAERDWYRYTLSLPMVAKPGTKAVYCSGGVNLAGGAIARAAHGWLPALFDRWLARPLGITRYAMNLTPTGEGYGGGGLYLRPRDALKLGQLALDGGTWKGTRLLGKGWLDTATTPHARMHKDSQYGYGWWLYTLDVGGHRYKEWQAGGNGGQFVAVIPALDLVVASTASNFGRFDIWYKFQSDILPRAILPAVAPDPE